ncbi:MAG: FtsW/RodA/SpoVE family cell cycle protein [Frisingicoccus sp.]|uniref:FtsW/RodA/SpoVE family cell cycle protein n=1 Tax=Frisingicoccus sp. TaxID=1918627 RepID=UPI0025C6E767|nr:FtsW/RodA/SpoVE family cell cycle protein [Frisingicoccus sp.]MDY4833989.1 FtsW/RodA/SpoVE family cell cycle protein [Frisingicoccus sp.]
MVNVIIHISKYILAILAASYAMKCFTVFSDRHEYDRGHVYIVQNVLMFFIHFICYLIIYLMTKDMKMLYFYAAQVVLFLVTLIVYGTVYKNASRLIINNMCYLLMVGFVILTRLDFDMAIRQFAIAVAAVCISLIIPAFILRVRVVDKWGKFLGIFGFLMIASVFVFGKSMYGATNWISIGGFSLQPSELAKIVFVFFVAAMLARDTSFRQIVITTAAAAGYVLVLVIEKDLGAAVIFFITYLVMLYVATRQFRYMALGLAAGSGAAVVAYKLFAHVRTRVIAWKDPWGNYNDAGYQIAQSLFAIGTGGWFGMGLFKGKPNTIPVVVSDFVFSAISEEMGALFAICLILVYFSCFLMFINISLQLVKPFYKLVAMGLSTAYGIQLFLCIGGVIKLIPHTGVTMPLISYGGSSVLSTIIIFAVIQGLYLLRQREVYILENRQNEGTEEECSQNKY